ncbi:MAG: ATP synthase subunit a [Candidatus Gottesmanbacteria bacterium GW2011_GWB1_43_11]|uniref:ATP synthase subunit a n=1 Tax=Candidatus Gottesmanbacteria bacterium GW2011_GWB1_43_11 TaxID=1618446 RepID=A0A0G1FHQ4_9BACT|nr:MAG: ATP synthase subunit a [Candidatus Gottesmanbacteria bacterium GW2011_GWA2_42_16]KKS55810.1 MAG: ATP synthase subunit a [Candidatus Gottesmanbacteria bacterium GW2011_GWA1_42_26]KKS82018.1 MAG: ATP synthase F0, A subunit, F-type H+-transporting ATPase subunit a [Candidatus Gottesmanbacteria bacterium GW2011_GWC1_43_10]KKS86378.1 MAG: ATP synthase subunit a [Candidatus Gottesmanbacteria bacterium GW2011_GWB1_43_11]OGG07967.1 MAG: ATP synthase F0 subunit A [Candidatus Gottesmanbacteria ba
MGQPHISLAAEKITSIAGWPVTNSILTTWLVMALLTVFALLVSRRISLVPTNLQQIAEIVIEGIHKLFTSVVGEAKIATFFPLLATLFLFIIIANWSGLLPGVGSVGLFKTEKEVEIVEKEITTTESLESSAKKEEFIPLFRGPTADLNTTLAMALIAFFSLHYYGFSDLGLGYFKRYFNLSNPIMFFVGILEIISDLSKIISFAFRLFGNIFAGEVLLTVIAFLMPVVAPLPFLGLELFVGFIQALVFSMLTAVFLNMATMSHGHE